MVVDEQVDGGREKVERRRGGRKEGKEEEGPKGRAIVCTCSPGEARAEWSGCTMATVPGLKTASDEGMACLALAWAAFYV